MQLQADSLVKSLGIIIIIIPLQVKGHQELNLKTAEHISVVHPLATIILFIAN